MTISIYLENFYKDFYKFKYEKIQIDLCNHQ